MKSDTNCTLCRRMLPCKLPPHERASRCPACQRLAYHTHQIHGQQHAALPPAEQAERARRIRKYAARAAVNAPLFAGVVWRPRFGMTFAEVG